MPPSLSKLAVVLNHGCNNGVRSSISPLKFLHFSSTTKPFSAQFTTAASAVYAAQSIVDYLVNRLALSPEAANAFAASKNPRISRAFTRKADSIVTVLREYGFTPTHISNIVIKYPSILRAKSEENIKAKLDFFSKNGISGSHLVEMFSREPGVCKGSLSNRIIPCFTFLLDFLGSSRDVVDFFMEKHGTRVLRLFSVSVELNVECLRKCGVPDPNILKLMTRAQRTLGRDCNEFSEIVKETLEMGFNPKSMMFVAGLKALSAMKKEKWASKMDVFKSFGWTEDQFKVLFMKQPTVLHYSEDHMRRLLDLFLNELGWRIDDISVYPSVLCLSIERRILPRAEALKVLFENGTLKNKVGNHYMVAEDKFLKKYVIRHLDKFPRLLEIYKEKKKMASVVTVDK